MSYIAAKRPVAVGGLLDDVRGIVQTTVSTVDATSKVIRDPNFPKVVNLINQAYSIEAQTAGSAASKGGSALGDLVMPLEVYVETKKKPWLKYAIPVLLLGLPLWVGYKMGERK